MIYTPDGYAVIRIQAYGSDDFVIKVFGSWSGGYSSGESWRINSGTIDIKDEGDSYLVTGFSGSQYKLSKEVNYIRPYNKSVLNDMIAELRSYGHKADIISIEDAIAIIGA